MPVAWGSLRHPNVPFAPFWASDRNPEVWNLSWPGCFRGHAFTASCWNMTMSARGASNLCARFLRSYRRVGTGQLREADSGE